MVSRTKVQKPALRAVDEGERPASRHTTIESASVAGSVVDELRLTRARIARTLDDPNCPPRDLASLSKRLLEIGREIEAIEAKDRQEAEEDHAATPDEEWDAEAI